MLLSPAERVLLLEILPPAEGNAVFLRAVRKLRKDLAFSDQEINDWHVVSSPPTSTSPGTCRWDGNNRVEIEAPATATAYIGAHLRNTEAAGKLHEGLLDVYDSFFPEG